MAATLAASIAWEGVGKSGSPADSIMMSMPAWRSSLALSVMAVDGEFFTPFRRCDRMKATIDCFPFSAGPKLVSLARIQDCDLDPILVVAVAARPPKPGYSDAIAASLPDLMDIPGPKQDKVSGLWANEDGWCQACLDGAPIFRVVNCSMAATLASANIYVPSELVRQRTNCVEVLHFHLYPVRMRRGGRQGPDCAFRKTSLHSIGAGPVEEHAFIQS